jgi:hypothetical protein
MAIRDMLLPEFDQEMANTRKMLERVPEDHINFQPHEKCWKMDRLSGHIADLPSWVAHTMQAEVLAMEPGQYKPFEPTSRNLLLERERGARGTRLGDRRTTGHDLDDEVAGKNGDEHATL